jgi:Protein of unknown function (DUF1579)
MTIAETDRPITPWWRHRHGWYWCTAAGVLAAAMGATVLSVSRANARPAGPVSFGPGSPPAADVPGQDRLHDLDFLLGRIKCRFDTGVTMVAKVQPILGGAFYQMRLNSWNAEGETVVDDGFWTVGWSEPDQQYLSYYFDNTGMHGHSSSPGWEDGKLKFTGPHVLIGGKVRTGTRDEFERISENHFVLNSYYQDENEEWQFYDRQDCYRKP